MDKNSRPPNNIEALLIARALGLYDEVIRPIENASDAQEVDKILAENPHAGRIGKVYGDRRKEGLS